MANALYPSFKETLLNKEHDMNTDTIKVYLIDSADYTYGSGHTTITDVAAGARVATSGALTSTTIASGVFDSADFAFTAVTGDQSEALIGWNDTTATDKLCWFMDTSITGMPVTPNGGDINVAVHASGWWTL